MVVASLAAGGLAVAQPASGGKGAPAAKAAGAPKAGEAVKAGEAPRAAADPAPARVPSAPVPGADAAGQAVRLRAIEQRVNELKERVFRSKARLSLLKETVLHGVIAGSRAVIKHVNDMGSSFRLIKLTYAVDGQQIYAKADDSGALDAKRTFEVFNGSIVPGNHTVSVQMVFRGHGYGIFSYLKGYKFTVRASHTFTAGEGRRTVLTVRAYEKGNITTELKDRPAIKFETSLSELGRQAAAEAAREVKGAGPR